MKRIWMIFCLALLLAGCGDVAVETKAQIAQQEQATGIGLPEAVSTNRIMVTRIKVVNDTIAYNGHRGVYVIKDHETGREYIGVSGVGIAERGSHSSGKTTSADER